MTFERVMGLHVIDDEEYQIYREGIEPILNSVGGSFSFDFKIATVLRSKNVQRLIEFRLQPGLQKEKG